VALLVLVNLVAMVVMVVLVAAAELVALVALDHLVVWVIFLGLRGRMERLVGIVTNLHCLSSQLLADSILYLKKYIREQIRRIMLAVIVLFKLNINQLNILNNKLNIFCNIYTYQT
jgi:hypothetical protein